MGCPRNIILTPTPSPSRVHVLLRPSPQQEVISRRCRRRRQRAGGRMGERQGLAGFERVASRAPGIAAERKARQRINAIRDDIVRSAPLVVRTAELGLRSTPRQINRSFARPRQNLIPLARPIKLRVSVIPGPNTPVYTLQVMV